MVEQFLAGKTALITGSGSGIGQALSIGFAQMGANIIITDINDLGMEETKKKVEAVGGKAIIQKADVTIYDDCVKVISAGKQAFGKIDILINNAGFNRLKSIAKIDINIAHTILKVNILGVYNFTHAIANHFLENKAGTIVNTGSLTVKNPMRSWSAYSMSKSALLGFTECLGEEWKSDGITINTLMPIMVDTPLFRMGQTQEDIDRLKPMKPEELVPYFAFFATADGKKVTGINVDIEICKEVFALRSELPEDKRAIASWKDIEPIAEQKMDKDAFKWAKKYRRLLTWMLDKKLV